MAPGDSLKKVGESLNELPIEVLKTLLLLAKSITYRQQLEIQPCTEL